MLTVGFSPEVILRQFQANFFGPLNVYRAILPHFREKRSGLLVTIGSMSAWYPLPGVNLYNSSKAALRSISLGLQSEVAGFGIKHCLIEPGYFRTELANPNANLAKLTEEDRLTDYAELNAVLDKTLDQIYGNELGDTAKGAEIIYEVLTGSGVAKGRDVPPFFPLGSDAVTAITKSAEQTLKEIKEWADISRLSDAPIGR